MKSVIACAAILGLFWPAVALADPPDCAQQLRQIYHHEDMVIRALEFDREDWAEKTQAHIDRLEERLANRCPRYSDRDERQEILRHLADLLRATAGTAATVLTLGNIP